MAKSFSLKKRKEMDLVPKVLTDSGYELFASNMENLAGVYLPQLLLFQDSLKRLSSWRNL